MHREKKKKFQCLTGVEGLVDEDIESYVSLERRMRKFKSLEVIGITDFANLLFDHFIYNLRSDEFLKIVYFKHMSF